MNSINQPDTCHVIVRHPTTAKFLVIKHEDQWSPPVLKFPPGQVDFKVRQINQGMKDKYGLDIRVLRPLQRLPHYHCIEAELSAQKSSKKIQAVWVDRSEYLRTRSDASDAPDPFETWFDQQAEASTPSNRAPFHKPGWFDQADHWIHFQLDRLEYQVTGSVEQFRLGWSSSCLLRVNTNQGHIYFKAGFGPEPGESVLVPALAEKWPNTIFRPLAVDTKRNWTLNRDFLANGQSGKDLALLPEFARTMAQLQVDSAQTIDRWLELGCQQFDLARIKDFCTNPDPYLDRLREGGGGLSSEEQMQFQAALESWGKDCDRLDAVGLPMMLVHPDFRSDNLVKSGDDFRILDWSDTVIAHPFLVMGRILRDAAAWRSDQDTPGFMMNIPPELRQQVIAAYLDPFEGFASTDELTNALNLAAGLDTVWSMMRTLSRLDWVERMTPHYYHLIVSLQNTAREAIRVKA